MAHAVHRTKHRVRLAEDATEPSGAVVDATVVVDELAVGPLDEVPEVTDEVRPPPDVRDPLATEIEGRGTAGRGGNLSRDPGSEHVPRVPRIPRRGREAR